MGVGRLSLCICFKKGKTIYTADEYGDDLLFDPNNTVNSYSLSLGEILTRKGSHIKYEYDFGDSWVHRITLESQQAYKKDETQGIFLIDGANACPPEDCGGIYGYQEMLEALKTTTLKKLQKNIGNGWERISTHTKF